MQIYNRALAPSDVQTLVGPRVGLTTDQRGDGRLVGAHIDIGAAEFQPGADGVDIEVQPVNAVAGQALQPIGVAVVDASGKPVPSDNQTLITLAIFSGPAGAKLGGTTTLRAVNGWAYFSNLTFDVAGTYTLTAISGKLTPDFSFDFTISAAAAADVKIHTQPGNGVVGQNISPAVTVAVVDKYGNIVTTSSRRCYLAIGNGPAGAILGGATTVHAVHGVATFTNLTLNLAGAYTLKATDGNQTHDFSHTFTIAAANVTSADLGIQPRPPCSRSAPDCSTRR